MDRWGAGMLSMLLQWAAERVEAIAKPPAAPVDKTVIAPASSGEQLEQMIGAAKAVYKMNPSYFNVAVVGAKSVGKSALINGLLHMSDDDPSKSSPLLFLPLEKLRLLGSKIAIL
jgi:ribosome biogenesis GTPase A